MRTSKVPLNQRNTAVVLGGDFADGAETAKVLGALGLNIIIPFTRSSSSANEVVVQIESRGGIAIALFADIRKASHLAAIISCGISAFGNVDIVACPSGLSAYLAQLPHGTGSTDEPFDVLAKLKDLLPAGSKILDFSDHGQWMEADLGIPSVRQRTAAGLSHFLKTRNHDHGKEPTPLEQAQRLQAPSMHMRPERTFEPT